MKLLAKAGILTFVLMLTMAVHAEPVSQLHPTGYVNAYAHVLEQKTVAQMEGVCQQIDQEARAQIAVVTINSLDGADIESYAVDLFKILPTRSFVAKPTGFVCHPIYDQHGS